MEIGGDESDVEASLDQAADPYRARRRRAA
jgi:hypothetical protein